MKRLDEIILTAVLFAAAIAALALKNEELASVIIGGALGRLVPTTPGGMAKVVKAGAAGAVFLAAVGCGGATIPVYTVTTTACAAAEAAVRERPGTTLEQDTEAVGVIRNICDVMFASIRELVANGGEP
jgi:hypothetical protein